MLGMIILFLCGWLIYAGLCRLVFGKPDVPQYYIVHEYALETVVDEVMERIKEEELEIEQEAVVDEPSEELCELPDNVVLFDPHHRKM